MELLLMALGVVLASGLLALVAGRRAGVCSAIGAGGAAVGCALGLVPVLRALVQGSEESFHRAWDVPYGRFSLELDPLSAWFLVPILALSGLAAIYGAGYLDAYGSRRPLGPTWFFYNLLVVSMAGVVLARNGVLFLVAWEVMSLASYFLVTFDDDDPAAREAGRTYLIATHLGTAFLLAFFVVLGRTAGSLEFAAIAAAGLPGPATAGLLFLLALVGFGTKAGFMPLHVWLPEAHPAAPSHVSAVMSGVMVKTGIYGLVRALSLLPPAPAWWAWVLIGVGVLSGVWGILFALAQHDLKRLLAYSTVENVGIMALGLGVGLLGVSLQAPLIAVLGLAGALFHVLNHAAFKGLLFLGAGTVLHATGTRDLNRLGGLARRMPWVAGAFTVGAVATTGLPPLNGFAGEFLIYLGAFRGGLAPRPSGAVPALLAVAALALIGGLAVVCFTKVVGIVFLGAPRTEAAAAAHRPGRLLVVPQVLLAAACVGIAVGSPRIGRMLVPIAGRVFRIGDSAALVPEALEPLWAILMVSGLLVAFVLALVLVRRRLLAGQTVGQGPTWDCGYARPTARMQYTASSYVQPATAFLGPLLRTRTGVTPAAGLFPQPGAFASETPDLWDETLYRPAFRGVGRLAARLRWVQQGRIHVYVMYIAITVLVLLVWFLGLVRGG